jgi:hypothetical protein
MNENLENLENEQPEEESLFRDKIFDNDFEQTELDTTEKSFSIDSNFVEKTFDEKIDEAMFYELIYDVLDNDPNINRFNRADENGSFPKINKSDINEIYRYVIGVHPDIPRIEVFSIITGVFDINPEKFYDSLSNTFKTELINELKDRGYLKNIKSLF